MSPTRMITRSPRITVRTTATETTKPLLILTCLVDWSLETLEHCGQM